MKLLLCVLSCMLSAIAGHTAVPVLIWSDRAPSMPSKSALQTWSPEEFQHQIVVDLASENILMLVQDQLSVEDLSSSPNSFTGFQNLVKNKIQTYLPSVQSPSLVASDLTNIGYHLIKTSYTDLGKAVLKKDSKNVVVVQLPKSGVNRQTSMEKTGQVLETILPKILSMGTFTIVLTATHPNEAVRNTMMSQNVHRIRKRSVSSKALKTECVLMHLKKDLAYVSGGTVHVLPTDKIDKAEGICSNDTSNVSLKISYSEVQVLGNVQVQLNFAKKGFNKWFLSSADVTESSKEKASLKGPNSLIHVKHGESLVSGQKIVMSAAGAQSKLILNDFQVQAFTKGVMKFGMANDNQGFFTIAIWTGLLSGLLLLAILLWGFYMLADLRTMDRFDDPKDKPLVGNSSD